MYGITLILLSAYAFLIISLIIFKVLEFYSSQKLVQNQHISFAYTKFALLGATDGFEWSYLYPIIIDGFSHDHLLFSA